MKLLFKHPELFPLFGICTTAMVGCTSFGLYKLFGDKSVFISKQKRQEILKN
jgi:hypothetical protein